jgi:hypothetical protein
VLLALPLAPYLVRRALFDGTVQSVRASADRFDEHIQMARFVQRFYDRDTVVINDIGAVSYYSHAHLLDIVGLGSALPVAILQTGRDVAPQDLTQWAASSGATVGLLNEQWTVVRKILPPAWIQAATLHFPRNTVFPDHDFSFYAITPQDVPRLCRSLAAFRPSSPRDALTFAPGICPALPHKAKPL